VLTAAHACSRRGLQIVEYGRIGSHLQDVKKVAIHPTFSMKASEGIARRPMSRCCNSTRREEPVRARRPTFRLSSAAAASPASA
jgi:hypothetical protein